MKIIKLNENFNVKYENGLCIIVPKIFNDSRGYFFETYNKSRFVSNYGNVDFIQDNESMSSRGVLRGLHYQYGNNAQAKLVRVIKESVIDFALDIRKSFETFGNLYYILLSLIIKLNFLFQEGLLMGFFVWKIIQFFHINVIIFGIKNPNAG